MRPLPNLALALLLLAGISACSSSDKPAAPSADAVAAATAQMEAKAEQHYAMYEEMLKADNAELALPLGD